jgi:hypothetical protein
MDSCPEIVNDSAVWTGTNVWEFANKFLIKQQISCQSVKALLFILDDYTFVEVPLKIKISIHIRLKNLLASLCCYRIESLQSDLHLLHNSTGFKTLQTTTIHA